MRVWVESNYLDIAFGEQPATSASHAFIVFPTRFQLVTYTLEEYCSCSWATGIYVHLERFELPTLYFVGKSSNPIELQVCGVYERIWTADLLNHNQAL